MKSAQRIGELRKRILASSANAFRSFPALSASPIRPFGASPLRATSRVRSGPCLFSFSTKTTLISRGRANGPAGPTFLRRL